MVEFILEYWLEVAFGLITGGLALALKWLNKKFNKKAKEYEDIRAATIGLLHERIRQEYNKYLDLGYCPLYAKQAIQGLYDQYHSLGGNGTATSMIEAIQEMPTREHMPERFEGSE